MAPSPPPLRSSPVLTRGKRRTRGRGARTSTRRRGRRRTPRRRVRVAARSSAGRTAPRVRGGRRGVARHDVVVPRVRRRKPLLAPRIAVAGMRRAGDARARLGRRRRRQRRRRKEHLRRRGLGIIPGGIPRRRGQGRDRDGHARPADLRDDRDSARDAPRRPARRRRRRRRRAKTLEAAGTARTRRRGQGRCPRRTRDRGRTCSWTSASYNSAARGTRRGS